ncbi:MAG: hypothetical protein HYW48_02010 [Deltaproteobacteria bacterium]|nr:hypothetical protein [Deltaproteobacteria bacterium]
MNVRLSRGLVRFRVHRNEFAKLKEGEALEERVYFPHGVFTFSVKVSDKDSQVSLADNVLTLVLSKESLEKVSTSGPLHDAELKWQFPLEDATFLKVRFEVDAFSLKQKRPLQGDRSFPGKETLL